MTYKLSEILQVPQAQLDALEESMANAGFPRVLHQVEQQNHELTERVLAPMRTKPETAQQVRAFLFDTVRTHEQELYAFVGVTPENFDFEKVAQAAREIATEDRGFFLRKEYAKDILRKRPPEQTMKYLGYSDVEELLEKQDIGDVFSALRFTETNEWMHKTFDEAYTAFAPEDFEERPIELRVLGPQWKEIAEKYVAKKHHNVSHLKEFGIIFLNPIAQTEPGKFLRDFALLLHYFHEIAFYSKLFRQYAQSDDFNAKFLSLLRGDVPETQSARPGDWLIVQRYLWKENPGDPRLFLPRVNPEAMHWRKAQEDLAAFGKKHEGVGLEFWDELWSVAAVIEGEIVSFELEDNAMGTASVSDGKSESFSYHQREALWNRIYAAYAGGYAQLERDMLEHMGKGIIPVP
ncbi:MAG: hypothetical protein Q8P39_00050 [Candidatus Yanofskybacteria bacterium]|nr:hypothetical protein [Candidatus Yanofskybacteria bacterium]